MNGYDKVCNALLTLGANPNAVNKISKTPLIYAAAEGHVKVLEELVKCENIDLEAKGTSNLIFVHTAYQMGPLKRRNFSERKFT